MSFGIVDCENSSVAKIIHSTGYNDSLYPVEWTLSFSKEPSLIKVWIRAILHKKAHLQWKWALKKLREPDLNQRPSGYEPDELPDCSTPRQVTIACDSQYNVFEQYMQAGFCVEELSFIETSGND